jgi:dGTPase
MSMQWNQLLSDFRIGRKKQYDRDKNRSPWQFDADRITFSSAFRRLKDKTQVFPLSSSDYVRTRLTHSIEVSSVGRSLGTRIGYFLLENGYITGKEASPEEIGAIVAAANLAHDIGNPPFGHSGEDAIRSWCLRSDVGRKLLQEMTLLERADFERYEGNAQGFRVLARLQLYRNQGGMQLTAATLGAYSKYPAQSWPLKPKPEYERHHKGKSTSKYGFFQADRETFVKLADVLGLPLRPDDECCWIRHPLAFVTEAADDICYRIVDLEDAYNQKLIRDEDVKGILSHILTESDIERVGREEQSDRIGVIRALAIRNAITEAAKQFEEHYRDIMSGSFDQSLIDCTWLKKGFDAIQDLQKRRVYCNDRVLKIEVAGFSVIGGLLDHFVQAANDFVESEAKHNVPAISRKILDLIPTQFFTDGKQPDERPYYRLLEIVDFISGMTDSYALNLFRSLTGIQLP